MAKRWLCASALLMGCLAACGTGSVTGGPGDDSVLPTRGTNIPPGKPSGAPGNPNSSPPNTMDNAGSATFEGTVGAIDFTPTNAIFAFGKGPDGVNQLAIKISDQADDCAVVSASAHRRGAKALWMRIRGVDLDTPMVKLGDAQRASTPAYAEFYALDSDCLGELPDAKAGSKNGTVDLQVGDVKGIATGQFKLTMGTQGDQISGTFAAAPCPGLLGLIANPAQVRTCE